MAYLINRPRQSILYGSLGILVVLVILLVVNARNWRPLKGKTIYFELTDQALAQLRDEDRPADLPAKLEGMKGQKYPTEEQFIHALEATLGKEETLRAKWKILDYARKTAWIATSNYSQAMAAFAIDGSFKTYWSSYAPMTFGMFFQVDIGTPVVINGLVLQVGKEKQGQPVKWVVKTSADGAHWQTITPRRPITSGSMLAIPFAAVEARYVQIIQTSISGTSSPWLIYELDLLQPIVPWQFERWTLIFWIVGYVFILVSVLLVVSRRVSSRENVLVLVIVTGVILVGWFYASKLYQVYRREKNLTPLIETIKTDLNDCKRVTVLDQRLTKLYPALSSIPPDRVEYSELKRFADQGIFWNYLLVSTSSGQNESENIKKFLDRDYTEIGRSTNVALYALRDPTYSRQQRYIWRDLFVGTGHHIEDQQSSTGVVRVGTKADPPGLLTFGPFCQVCKPGHYIARFAVRTEEKSAAVVAILEVVANTYDSLVRLEVKGTDFGDATAYQTFDVPFALDMSDNPAFQMKRLQFVVHFTGKAEVRVDYIELLPDYTLN